MKKVFLMLTAAVAVLGLVTFVACDKDDDKEETKQEQGKEEGQPIADVYVDLGLTSGNKWKNENEEGLYDYSNDVKLSGNKMPTTAQWQELLDEGIWLWQNNGFKVTGPNGKDIFLPLIGYRGCQGGGVSNVAYYWAVDTATEDRYVPALHMFGGRASMYYQDAEAYYGACVRFVQN